MQAVRARFVSTQSKMRSAMNHRRRVLKYRSRFFLDAVETVITPMHGRHDTTPHGRQGAIVMTQ